MPTYIVDDEELLKKVLPGEATEVVSKQILKNNKVSINWK